MCSICAEGRRDAPCEIQIWVAVGLIGMADDAAGTRWRGGRRSGGAAKGGRGEAQPKARLRRAAPARTPEAEVNFGARLSRRGAAAHILFVMSALCIACTRPGVGALVP